VNTALDQLARDYWEHQLETSPTQALLIGDHRYDEKFEDPSLQAENAKIAALREFARAAEEIDPATLSEQERITREVLIFEASTIANMAETRAAEMAVSHTTGIQTMIPAMIPQLPLVEPEHALAMRAKFRGIAQAFDTGVDRLRDGVAAGRVPMASTAEKTVEQLDALLTAEHSPLLNLTAPQHWDGEAAWREEMAAIVADEVNPAIRRWRDTIVDTVIPASRSDDRPGLCHIPGCDEWYAKSLYRFTTTDKTAEQIHQVGLDQVAKLDDEYREIAGPVLETTDLDEIYTRMREDPELRYQEGPPIIEAAKVAMAKAKEAMGDWFGRLPKADCAIVETPYGPAAYYFPPAADGSRPGTYFVNTSDPAKWATYEIENLTYHEAIPGHHLQLAISTELEDIPEFRKYALISAYAEGWGLYTERLADEMGLYGSALDRIGMLANDSLRAGRLVVDTGIHAKGWTRQQAIDFLMDNSPMSRVGIEAEVDRYISWPGQACSYMIGRLEILRMRAAAEAALGEKFDIKGFHDTVLGSGLVPLGTLDGLVKDWVMSRAG
jgi:uncharacterized protein (DUF885 family)